MTGADFFDTNVLLYMYNDQDREKQVRARALFREAAQKGRLVVSAQVVQEVYVAGSRKLNLPREELRERVPDRSRCISSS
jgi:predicted nucleic acid-binding protein